MKHLAFIGTVMAAAFLSIFLPCRVRAKSLQSEIPEAWTMYEPDPDFEFHGMRPGCAMGDPFYFFARRGTSDNLVIFFDGGGACWHASNCFKHPTYAQNILETEESFERGIFDVGNPANPFREWSQVFIPYCTGDLHLGAKDAEYDDEGSAHGIIRHRGFVNFQSVLKWITANFRNPGKILVSGSSAGSYAAMWGLAHVQEVYPNSDCILLGDGGNGVITKDFLEEALKRWGLLANAPDWIPGLREALSSERAVPEMYKALAKHYPNSRIAQYATAYDAVQVYFYNLMLDIDRSVHDPQIWEQVDTSVSERWHSLMSDYVRSASEKSPNYSYYIGEGKDHTILGYDKFYQEESGGGPFLLWLEGIIGGNSGKREPNESEVERHEKPGHKKEIAR